MGMVATERLGRVTGHSGLLQCVARRIVDRDMLRLIKMWLKVLTSGEENG
jgi:hypothetical protein